MPAERASTRPDDLRLVAWVLQLLRQVDRTRRWILGRLDDATLVPVEVDRLGRFVTRHLRRLLEFLLGLTWLLVKADWLAVDPGVASPLTELVMARRLVAARRPGSHAGAYGTGAVARALEGRKRCGERPIPAQLWVNDELRSTHA